MTSEHKFVPNDKLTGPSGAILSVSNRCSLKFSDEIMKAITVYMKSCLMACNSLLLRFHFAVLDYISAVGTAHLVRDRLRTSSPNSLRVSAVFSKCNLIFPQCGVRMIVGTNLNRSLKITLHFPCARGIIKRGPVLKLGFIKRLKK